MSKEFTAKQKEIVARKLGYDGPMSGFDEFLQSSPALAMKYGMVADKYMAKGGMVKKYADGGVVSNASQTQDSRPDWRIEDVNNRPIMRSGNYGISLNAQGVPQRVSYFDDKGNELGSSAFYPELILEKSQQFGLNTEGLRGLADAMDANNIGFRPYELYKGTGSDQGIDLDELASGGLGTAYDWRVDNAAGLKGPTANATLERANVAAQKAGIAEPLGQRTGGISENALRPLKTKDGVKNFAVYDSGRTSWFNTEREAQNYARNNGGTVKDLSSLPAVDVVSDVDVGSLLQYGTSSDYSQQGGRNISQLNFNVSQISSPQEKAAEYLRLKGQGFTDSQIRSAANQKFGVQSESDWNTLTSMANQNNVTAATTSAPTGRLVGVIPKDVANYTPQMKAVFYQSLRSSGFTDAEIRQGTEATLGKQNDADWSALTSMATPITTPSTQNNTLSNLAKNATRGGNTGVTTMPGGVTDSTFTTTVAPGRLVGAIPKTISEFTPDRKAAFYKSLRDSGYSDAEIREGVESTLGKQSDSDWSTLTSMSTTKTNQSNLSRTHWETTYRNRSEAEIKKFLGMSPEERSRTYGNKTPDDIYRDVANQIFNESGYRIDTTTGGGTTGGTITGGSGSTTTRNTTGGTTTTTGTTGGTTGGFTPGSTTGRPEFTEVGGVPIQGKTSTTIAATTATEPFKLDATKYQAAANVPDVQAKLVDDIKQATATATAAGQTYDATKATDAVKSAMAALTPAQGTVSAPMKAEQGQLSADALAKAVEAATAAQVKAPAPMQATEGMLAKAATAADVGGPAKAAEAAMVAAQAPVTAAEFEGATPEVKAATAYNLKQAESAKMVATAVEAAAKAGVIPQATAMQTAAQSTAIAQERQVADQELVDVSKQALQITEPVQAVAAVASKLNQDAIAVAQQGNFSQALATAEQGRIEAASTVQGQLTSLMEQFNDGTPAWAAGAIRSANAAMAARGLAGSSMAGAAIVQAAMEAATPIAAADAQIFAQMQLTNLNNRQQVALANAAAAQNLELANLSARQQAALQNSANAFSLQSQNLSNQQSVILANAQIRAAVDAKNLDVKTSVALSNAARFAEVNNINLSNRQQAALQRSAENIQIDLANLSANQQTALANLQVRAAITGQELSNEQQVAMLTSTQRFEAAQFNATSLQQALITDFQARAALEGQSLSNQQQALLFNATAVLEERKIELNNKQQTALFNATKNLEVDIANASNKQQTALANAQIAAALKGQELSNQQQVNVLNAARISEIANINFTAEQQNALANAKFIQDINLQDMSNRQAVVLSNAAAIASMDMANLNARQQAAVQNAQAFLQMDMANLSNKQQTSLFSAQMLAQVAMSDAAAENAAKQFNASSKQQADQFAASLTTQVSQFNSAQHNAMKQFNAGQTNAMQQFNTQMDVQREQFNVQNRTIIDQANAQLLAQISTGNTAAINAVNLQNAQSINNMTLAQYNNEVQLYRDQVKMVYDSFERAEDRAAEMAIAVLSADLRREAISAETSSALARLIGSVLTGTKVGDKILDTGLDFIKNLFGG